MKPKRSLAVVYDKDGVERTIAVDPGKRVEDVSGETLPPATTVSGGHKGASTRIVTRKVRRIQR